MNGRTYQIIHDLIDEFLDSAPRPGAIDLRPVALATQALPVYADIGGCLALHPDGRIYRYEWDDESVREETDDLWRSVALQAAGERFPQLASLRPASDPRIVA